MAGRYESSLDSLIERTHGRWTHNCGYWMTGGSAGSGLPQRLTPSLRTPDTSGVTVFRHAPRTAWWMPLAFVALVLAVLTATPVIVSYRVRKLRDQLADGSGAGRVIVNDLEVAFATQLLMHEQAQLDGAHAGGVVATWTACRSDNVIYANLAAYAPRDGVR